MINKFLNGNGNGRERKKRLAGIAVFSIVVIYFVFFAGFVKADDISAGLSVSNGICGTAEPAGAFSYDRDNDQTPAHLRLTVGPNGGCNGQAVTVDFLVETRHYLKEKIYTFAGAGYDQRSVPFEYEPAATKQFYGQEVETAQALFGFGFDGGDWYCQASYNAVETDMVDGGTLNPVQATCSFQLLGNIEVNATTNADTSAFDFAYDAGTITLSGSVSFDYSDLGNPAPDYLADQATGVKYMRQGAPSTLYSVQAMWNF